MSRIHLSPPDVGVEERALLLDAFDSNWIAPLGPHVDAFERELAARAGVAHGAALSSGTAALHLALRLCGVGPGDDVLVPTLTFVATANAAVYLGARPVLVDADPTSWCLDVDLVAENLEAGARAGRPPAAVVAVDLYGNCPDYERLEKVCAEHGVSMVEDAAEALGSSLAGRPAGSFGRCAAFSFNGNKVITTSGGGMLVSDDADLVGHARSLASQARLPVPHYEHEELGYNYRLSNLLAALGRGQLRSLEARLARRRAVAERYPRALAGVPGLTFMPIPEPVASNHWLTCVLIDAEELGATPEDLRLALEAIDVEARPTWKPLHRQRLYADAPTRGGAVADDVFARGLCLPSGSSLAPADQERIIERILETAR